MAVDYGVVNALAELRPDVLTAQMLSIAGRQPEYIEPFRRLIYERFSGFEQENLLFRLDGEAFTAPGGGYEQLFKNITQKPTVKYGSSSAFHDKEFCGKKRYCAKHKAYDGCWAFGWSFNPSEAGLEEWAQHVTSGLSWTPGYFADNSRRKDTFLQSELLALDFDENVSVDDLLKIPFFKQYACLIYPTPSSTPEYAKSRPVFRLDRPITDVQEWEALQAGLIACFAHLSPDEKCKDAARFYYGSHQPGAYVNLEAVLPAETLKAFIAENPEHSTPALHPTQADLIRLDSEIGRLSIALNCAAVLRLWAIARTKAAKWELEAFWQEMAAHGIEYSDKHKERLIAQGEELVFWNHDKNTDRLFMRRPGAELTRRAQALDPDLIESNLPGLKRDVYIPITAQLEQWEALIYAGWIAAKKQSNMTREMQCRLFNRSKRTILRWEREHLTDIVKTTTNIAQTKQTPEECNAPAHYYTYTVIVSGAGELDAHTEKRTAWQLPNTYTSKIKTHKRNGQRKRILKKAKIAAGLQPFNEKSEGLPRNARQVFTNSDKARKAACESGEAVKLLIGRTKYGHRKFEPTLTGIPVTAPDEPIKPASRECWYD